ncbi:dnaJ homolog subfamily C member 24 isoform X2 [Callithrix jacchus]
MSEDVFLLRYCQHKMKNAQILSVKFELLHKKRRENHREHRRKGGKEYHPDKQSTDVPAGTVEERVQKFIEIDQAWKILGNEETKREYDLQRCEDDLRSIGPVDAQVYLEEMSWNEDDHSFYLSCRCGGKYSVSKDEAEEVNLISCDTCSLIIELLHHN